MRSLVLLLLAARAAADAIPPAKSKAILYEGYSPLRDGLYGPLTPSSARLLPRWLEATVDGDVTEVVFRPDGAVRWRMVRGPRGMVEKTTLVDGQPWTRSRFSYDGDGRIAVKEVTGPGVGGATVRYLYRTDERGRIVERTGGGQRWTVRWRPDGATSETFLDGETAPRRRDRWDAAGNLLGSEALLRGTARVAIGYQRDAAGRLVRVTRARAGEPAREATFAAPDPSVTSEDVEAVSSAWERWEAVLALGAPTTHSVDGRGAERRVRDFFGSGCWLNRTSGLRYDAAERVAGGEVGCVCGLCVDARAEVAGDDVVGRDEHFTRGPWVRLDGALDVTADHRLEAARGPVAAGALRAGDVVRAAGGGWRRLRSVRRVDGARLGVNLRTRGGTFTAGGFVLVSETGACDAVANPDEKSREKITPRAPSPRAPPRAPSPPGPAAPR